MPLNTPPARLIRDSLRIRVLDKFGEFQLSDFQPRQSLMKMNVSSFVLGAIFSKVMTENPSNLLINENAARSYLRLNLVHCVWWRPRWDKPVMGLAEYFPRFNS